MKYLVFMFAEHDELGGWLDLKGRAGTLKECDEIIAREWKIDKWFEDFQIVDAEKQIMVDSGRMDDTARFKNA